MSRREYPTVAFILTLIGGILGLIVALMYFALALGALFIATGAARPPELPMIGHAGAWVAGVCGWFLIAQIIILIGAFKIKSGIPETVRTWGIIVLIFSIIGGGNLLSLIGGILALVWKPPKPVEAPPPPPPT
ncbi:MAG: hypothetical protein ABWW65_04855 [Thermoprotei archaeon]